MLTDHDALGHRNGEYGPSSEATGWEKARLRHRLARCGVIPWQADFSRAYAAFRPPFGEDGRGPRSSLPSQATPWRTAINLSTKGERLSIEQAMERLRSRATTEIKALNEHLPLSRRLERKEIHRLVDDLLFAVRDMLKRKKGSPLNRAFRVAMALCVRTIRQRSRRRKARNTMALRTH